MVAVLLLVSVTDDGIICESFVPYTETNTFLVLKLCVTAIVDWLSNEEVIVATSAISVTTFVIPLPSPTKYDAVIAPFAKLIDWLTNDETICAEDDIIPFPLVSYDEVADSNDAVTFCNVVNLISIFDLE